MALDMTTRRPIPMDLRKRFGRDSFDDRICDDLSQEVLKYLSFADKIRLQCVSKRFAKTIFVRQNRLVIRTKYVSWWILEKYLNCISSSVHSHLTLPHNNPPYDQEIDELMNSDFNHQQRYGMIGMDYDSLDQMVCEEIACTGHLAYKKINIKAFESGFDYMISIFDIPYSRTNPAMIVEVEFAYFWKLALLCQYRHGVV